MNTRPSTVTKTIDTDLSCLSARKNTGQLDGGLKDFIIKKHLQTSNILTSRPRTSTAQSSIRSTKNNTQLINSTKNVSDLKIRIKDIVFDAASGTEINSKYLTV